MKMIKSSQYKNLDAVYAQCSGPGGLALAEYIAEHMGIHRGGRMVDIGTYRGYQTCFLAKEYGLQIVGLDPLDDRVTGKPHIQHLMDNAADFGVTDQVIGIQTGVPESLLPSDCFDYAYSTTALEMVRGYMGPEGYLASLKEIRRILKTGGVFGLGEPMHFDVPVPDDLIRFIHGNGWADCFATLEETEAAVRQAGFKVLRSGYCEEAEDWWNQFIAYSPDYDRSADDVAVIRGNRKRWLSFGFVIAVK